MKRLFFIFFIMFILIGNLHAQVYDKLSGSIRVNVDLNGDPDGTFTITILNKISTGRNIQFYLSYQGKKVSDVYTHYVPGGFYSAIFPPQDGELVVEVIPWPNIVPKGHEKYVTLQYGGQNNRDRRDDG